MQNAIQLFDLWGQGLNTAGGAQKIAVKMPANGRWAGQQEPADGFAALMSMLMALPEEDLRTSLSLLDWVPLEEAGDQLVPMIDLTASEGSGFQMVAQMLESGGPPRQAPFFGQGAQGIAPGPNGELALFSSAQDQAAAAAIDAVEPATVFSAPVGTPVGNAVIGPATAEPPATSTPAPTGGDSMARWEAPANHAQPPAGDDPMARETRSDEAAAALKAADMPLENGGRQWRGLPTHAEGTGPEHAAGTETAEPPHKAQLPISRVSSRTGPDTPQMTQGNRIAADAAVSPETGKVSLESAKPLETAARAISGESAVAGAAEEALPEPGFQSGSGGREQMSMLAQKPQPEGSGLSAEPTAEKQAALPPREPATADIMRQIVERMTLRADKLQSQMHIRLKPEFLGDVRLQIATENQQVMVRISAQSQAVKEMIEQNVLQLKNELQQHGLQIDKFDVFVGADSGNLRQRRNPTTAEQRYVSRRGRSTQWGAAEVEGAMNVDAGQNRGTRGGVDFFA